MNRNSNQGKPNDPAWHQLEAEEVVRLLEADLQHGLKADDVKRRQQKFGPNRVTARAIAGQIGLGASRSDGREVLDCGSPLPLSDSAAPSQSARGLAQSKTLTRESAPPVVAISGKELEKLSDEQLEDAAERAAVFARVAPEQKFRLVKALQARGHVVAMTGDGVNDAPALKQADIGIAMGITGTDVAKGAADMILTDDNFASIEAAVEEGRCVFDNLTKFLVWTLPTNAGEALTILIAIFAGMTLPVLPVQLLWINMTTAVLLGLMLVFEPKERDVMLRPPRDPKQPILTFPLLMRTGLVTLIMTAGAIFLFHWEQQAEGETLAEARTIVVNTIVTVELFYLLNCRSLIHSMFSVGVFSNPWILWGCASMIAAQLLFTYAPVMNRLFHTAPIRAPAWLHILAVAGAAYAVVGLEKWIRSRFERNLRTTPPTND